MRQIIKTVICSLSLIPLIAQADVSVINRTNEFGVAKWGILCSSSAKERGTIRPNSTFTVPSKILDMFCKTSCHAEIYTTEHCSTGKLIARVTVNAQFGVIGIENEDSSEYTFTNNGQNVIVEYAKPNLWQRLVKRFF